MRDPASWCLLLLSLSLGCNGDDTGGEAPRGAGDVPQGAQLLKSSVARESSPELSQADATALGAGNRAFAFDLYRELALPGENLFFSPFSVSVALGMAYPGAEGETEAQLGGALHFELPEPALHSAFNATLAALEGRGEQLAPEGEGTGFELRIVNQAWGQQGYPFLDGYLDVLARHYGSGLFAVDFGESEATRQLINDWVSEQTEARVKDLLPADALTVDSRLVLTNAIYFKASWLLQFDEADTTEGVFRAPGAERRVPLMRQKLFAQYSQAESYQSLELPYLSPDVRMLLILPAEGEQESVTEAFGEAMLAEVRANAVEHDVTLTLPRFQLESENPLRAALSALGMPLPFSDAADFSGIAGGVEPLWIDEVYHKAFVSVDEEGTEAAAATAVVFTTESGKPSAEISFDRPFLFAIYDEPTGQILFMGQLVDPG